MISPGERSSGPAPALAHGVNLVVVESDVLPLQVPVGLAVAEAAVEVRLEPLDQGARRGPVGGAAYVQLVALSGHLAGQVTPPLRASSSRAPHARVVHGASSSRPTGTSTDCAAYRMRV